MSLIPASKFLNIQNDEKIEPKIVLELINELKINDIKPDPINNPINFEKENIIIDKPQPIQQTEKINEEIPIIKNLVVTKQEIEDIDLKINKIENESIKINKPQIQNNIIIPTKNNEIKIKPLEKLEEPLPIKPVINAKINTDIKIENNEIKIKPLEKLEEPLPIKPVINAKINPDIKIKNIDNQINISNLPSKVINSNKKIKKIIIKNDNTLSETQLNALENYKNEIRSEIKLFANENYPTQKQRNRKIQGIVQLIFRLNTDGSIISITNGPNTKAPEELVTKAINALRKSAPFNSNDLLQEKNEFSINIVYKLP